MYIHEPILTVIIFAYNHERTISHAIDSVLRQHTNYPYEIWLCEDCSTDRTLDICKQYEERYPDKIKVFAQQVNTYRLPGRQNHVHQAFSRINRKYFCYLDGDDFWSDPDKIQIALDFLENNPEYTIFAHDTLIRNHQDGTENSQSLVVKQNKISLGSKITLENLLNYKLFFHPSSRIHRNIIDLSSTPDGLMVDIFFLYVFLDKGPLYYHDKLMSVYNVTGTGSWSMLSKKEQKKSFSNIVFKVNCLLDYRYDFYLSKMVTKRNLLRYLKLMLGKKLGWSLWYSYMFRSWPLPIPEGCCGLTSQYCKRPEAAAILNRDLENACSFDVLKHPRTSLEE